MCLRRVAFFLRRKRATNFYRKATAGRGLCAPPKRKNHALKILRDQRQRRTTADDSKFRLRPAAPSYRPERMPKPWFWHAFGYFSHAGKVTKSAPKPRFWNPFPADRRGSRRPMPTSARTQESRAENSAHLRRGRRPRRPEQKYTAPLYFTPSAAAAQK